jgi:UDP-glucose 4-epimerase
MTKVLVTGGCGFIGSHLVELLLNKGYEVNVLDNLSTGRISNLNHIVNNKNLNILEGSLLDSKIISESLNQSFLVI